MGQGLYTMIALGTTKVPERPDSVDEDDWWGWQDALDSVEVHKAGRELPMPEILLINDFD